MRGLPGVLPLASRCNGDAGRGVFALVGLALLVGDGGCCCCCCCCCCDCCCLTGEDGSDPSSSSAEACDLDDFLEKNFIVSGLLEGLQASGHWHNSPPGPSLGVRCCAAPVAVWSHLLGIRFRTLLPLAAAAALSGSCLEPGAAPKRPPNRTGLRTGRLPLETRLSPGRAGAEWRMGERVQTEQTEDGEAGEQQECGQTRRGDNSHRPRRRTDESVKQWKGLVEFDCKGAIRDLLPCLLLWSPRRAPPPHGLGRSASVLQWQWPRLEIFLAGLSGIPFASAAVLGTYGDSVACRCAAGFLYPPRLPLSVVCCLPIVGS